MQTVGFIGLGNMGAGIAANIQKAGYPLVVTDLRRDVVESFAGRGAKVALSPAELAKMSDVVFTSLPGPTEVEAVVGGDDGILSAIRSGSVYVDLTTNRPSLILELAKQFESRGVSMLDAPVSGGKAGAASGNLAVMAGGDQKVFEDILPILNSFGDKVFYAGKIGNGTVCKLVHNLIAQNMRQIVAEGLTLGVKAGVDTEILWEGVRRGAVGRARFIHETLVNTVFRNKFEPANFTLSLAKKDVDFAIELGHELNVPLPVTNLVHQSFIEGINRGWQDKDSNILFCLQEEAADVEVRATGIDAAKAAKFITTHPEIQATANPAPLKRRNAEAARG